MEPQVVPILSDPGIKRDGTAFDGTQYVDGQWCRFDRARPRKMGGYRSINKFLNGLARTLSEYTKDMLTYIHAGSAERVERFQIDNSFNTSNITDRTPAGLTANDNNLWQFTIDHAVTTGIPQIIAQVAPNLADISNSSGGELYYGPLFATTALTAITLLPATYSATGGVLALQPYTIVFGNTGFVMWSVPGNAIDFLNSGAGNAYATTQKIVAGLPLRVGAANSPGALLWSLDSLIQMSFIGGTPVFSFDILSSQSSIMSSACVIEYDGIFYWLGVDRFLMFNGVVREIPNTLNRDWFFDNINYAYRQTIFAFKVPRWGEIWWCYPRGASTEPNYAVIFNVREGTWYDTALPEGGRCSGLFPAVFRRPLMAGVEPEASSVSAVTVSAAGTLYTVGDVLTVTGGVGNIAALLSVDTVGGGGDITAISVANAGSYTVQPTNPVSVTGGTGSGATFDLDFISTYKFWVHETGLNKADGQTEYPIQSYFETAEISLPVTAATNKQTEVVLIEPDFVQTGDMTVQITGQANPRAASVAGDILTFADSATSPEIEVVYANGQRRMLRFRFESNTLGGNYLGGQPLAHIRPSDGTVIGAAS